MCDHSNELRKELVSPTTWPLGHYQYCRCRESRLHPQVENWHGYPPASLLSVCFSEGQCASQVSRRTTIAPSAYQVTHVSSPPRQNSAQIAQTPTAILVRAGCGARFPRVYAIHETQLQICVLSATPASCEEHVRLLGTVVICVEVVHVVHRSASQMSEWRNVGGDRQAESRHCEET